MHVVVALTDAGEVEDGFEIVDDRIPPEYLHYELNEWDEYALEEAVQLKDEGLIEDVTTVTLGPPRTEESIRKGLAKGADRAVRVWDENLTEDHLESSRIKARLLGAAIREESPDLVFTGVQTADRMFGSTGVMIASQLQLAWAAVVTDLALDADAQEVTVRRELEGGIEERTTLELPAVCTIQTGINEPRYASLRGIRMAQRTEIESKTLTDLGLDTETLDDDLRRVHMQQPTVSNGAQLLEGDPTDTAAQLATLLRERGVIE